MARSSSGIVVGLTAGALAVVGFLAFQASATAPAHPPTPSAAGSKTPQAPAPSAPAAKPDAVPADSGTGQRVVWSLAAKRVWLVPAQGKARTFTVMPSSVVPQPGTYAVNNRTGAPTTGSDGVRIEHIVRFTAVEGVTVGFSARTDGAMPEPDMTKKTGGVRMTRADGDAMWNFATVGVKVVVVP
ncbi:hypothetical protein ACN20G_09150 [Streptomyces sp. BI20]|uniref:hypothetical protein n=1 Tax=Streptomyces sp. BI20 TaxID=3403460 RepID=UPI003C773DA7